MVGYSASFGARIYRLLGRFLASSFLLFALPLFASDPTTATLNPTSSYVEWVGTAVAGTNPAPQLGEESHDDTSVDGVNRDSFVLKVSGKPGDWTGKVIRISISWMTPAFDYDFYVHKGSANGPVVARGTNGVTNFEQDSIDPRYNSVLIR